MWPFSRMRPGERLRRRSSQIRTVNSVALIQQALSSRINKNSDARLPARSSIPRHPHRKDSGRWHEDETGVDGELRPRFTPLKSNLVPLPDDGRLAVVGESYYQAALSLAADGRPSGNDFDSHIPVIAALVPEPENPYDENAVRIDVVMGNATLKVGYLARTIAPDYQPVLLKLRIGGFLGTCPARVTGGGDKYYGIYLHIVTARELTFANETGDHRIAKVSNGAGILSAEWSCTVTKEGNHQDVLSKYAPASGESFRNVVASLHYCKIASGKHRGQSAIEVQLNGNRVGELTRGMTARYADVVDRLHHRGLVPKCEGMVVDTPQGLQVELLMPRGH